jgi:hypothetical protein
LPGYSGSQQNQINVIQQIDSLNAIACGDSSLILKTSDGGNTWQKQHLDSANHVILSVHFSDSMTGIMTHGDYVHQVSITTDGGENWVGVPMSYPYIFTACHSYGGGSFRVLNAIYNRIYSTTDYWNTIHSSALITTVENDSVSDQVYYCDSSSGDTMIAYGWRSFKKNGFSDSSGKIVVRTTDGGDTWIETVLPFIIPVSIVTMSPLDRDTVFSAGGNPSGGMFLESVDHGATWFQDTIILDTDYTDDYSYSPGMSITGDGHAIAIILPNSVTNVQGIIVRREQEGAGIAEYIPIVQSEQIYPNPASSSVTITSLEAGSTVHLLDILGREVLHGVVPSNGALMMDVSSLPSGLYYVSDGVTRTKFVKE